MKKEIREEIQRHTRDGMLDLAVQLAIQLPRDDAEAEAVMRLMRSYREWRRSQDVDTATAGQRLRIVRLGG